MTDANRSWNASLSEQQCCTYLHPNGLTIYKRTLTSRQGIRQDLATSQLRNHSTPKDIHCSLQSGILLLNSSTNPLSRFEAVSFTIAIKKDASSLRLPINGRDGAAFSRGFGRGEEKCRGMSQFECMSKKHSSFQKQEVKKRTARRRLQ